MNYYKHHIGDYDSATSHLSWGEDMAYTRLIRLYYRREAPLPSDLTQVCRLIRASKKEVKFVRTVLDEFFILSSDGWHNKRCDEEIADSQARSTKNREVGKKGGRPKKKETQMVSENNPDGLDKETQMVSENNPDGLDKETQMVSENNPSHKPIANSHNNTYLPTSQARAREGAFPISAQWEPSEPFWDLAKRSSHTPENPDYADALTDFVAYWLTNPGVCRTQSQWEKTFLESWKRYRSHAVPLEKTGRKRTTGLSPHGDFDKRDYTTGLNPDGSF